MSQLLTIDDADTIRDLVRQGTRLLTSSASARLDAELLLSSVLGIDRIYLLTQPDQRVPQSIVASYRALINERHAGIPIAYLLGEREFWSLRLEVSRDTLVPRADTELLVSLALERLPAAQPATIVDLGTGCGAIAIAISCERPNWRLLGIDKSLAALRIAERNRRRHNRTNLYFLAGDWTLALRPGRADLIVSNPPYIENDDCCLTESDIRHEPAIALRGGPDGLQSIAAIIDSSTTILRAGGHLLVEHGAEQGDASRGLFLANGYRNVMTHRDLSGHERVTSGQWLATESDNA
jgi:release factor glutamine methyltransferase